MASVNEAKTNLSGILANVEDDLVFMMTIRESPQMAFKISDKDLFSDDSGL